MWRLMTSSLSPQSDVLGTDGSRARSVVGSSLVVGASRFPPRRPLFGGRLFMLHPHAFALAFSCSGGGRGRGCFGSRSRRRFPRWRLLLGGRSLAESSRGRSLGETTSYRGCRKDRVVGGGGSVGWPFTVADALTWRAAGFRRVGAFRRRGCAPRSCSCACGGHRLTCACTRQNGDNGFRSSNGSLTPFCR